LLLKDKGTITREFIYDKPYLCPICLREFSEEHLDSGKFKNYLTAEDSPPFALEGSKIALTKLMKPTSYCKPICKPNKKHLHIYNVSASFSVWELLGSNQ
jgi:hypothetical protein